MQKRGEIQKGFLLIVVVLLVAAFFASYFNDITGEVARSSRGGTSSPSEKSPSFFGKLLSFFLPGEEPSDNSMMSSPNILPQPKCIACDEHDNSLIMGEGTGEYDCNIPGIADYPGIGDDPDIDEWRWEDAGDGDTRCTFRVGETTCKYKRSNKRDPDNPVECPEAPQPRVCETPGNNPLGYQPGYHAALERSKASAKSTATDLCDCSAGKEWGMGINYNKYKCDINACHYVEGTLKEADPDSDNYQITHVDIVRDEEGNCVGGTITVQRFFTFLCDGTCDDMEHEVE